MLYKVTRCYVNEMLNFFADKKEKEQYVELLKWLDKNGFKYSLERTYDMDSVLSVYKETDDIYRSWQLSSRDSSVKHEVKDFWFDISGMKEYLLKISKETDK